MKGFKTIYRTLLLVVLAWASVEASYAQNTKKDRDAEKIAAIENLINSKKYVFVAETMNPLGGRTMFLNSFFALSVADDRMQSDLPYFGRAYMAPIDPTRGALQFTSQDFEYSVTTAKKGGWDVAITPNDNREVRQMTLNISPKGNAFLQVISNNRQAISFNGLIRPFEPKKNNKEE